MKKLYVDSDFDGLVSSYFLKQIYPKAEVIFTTPKTLWNETLTKEDIIADLPKPENFQGKHYDHHEPYGKTCLKANSCAEVILKLNPKLLSGKNVRLAKAASRIDTAKLTKDLHPEEVISMTLNLNGKRKDDNYRMWLLQELVAGKSLKEISVREVVQARLKKKQGKTPKYLETAKIEKTNIYGIKFATIRGLIPTTYLNEIFKEEIDYIIKIHKDCVQITANVFKKNPVDLLTIVKKVGGAGKKDRVYFYGEEHTEAVMGEISIARNEEERK